MSIVSILDISVPNNPAPFLSPFSFEITFESLRTLEEGCYNKHWQLYIISDFFFEKI